MILDLIIAGIIAGTPTDNLDNCTKANPCLNGNVPSYQNPNCWPGAIYCPAPGTPPDKTVTNSVTTVTHYCRKVTLCTPRSWLR